MLMSPSWIPASPGFVSVREEHWRDHSNRLFSPVSCAAQHRENWRLPPPIFKLSLLPKLVLPGNYLGFDPQLFQVKKQKAKRAGNKIISERFWPRANRRSLSEIFPGFGHVLPPDTNLCTCSIGDNILKFYLFGSA